MTDPSSSFSYIVNVPMYFNGDEEKAQKDAESLLNKFNHNIFEGRNVQILVGFNRQFKEHEQGKNYETVVAKTQNVFEKFQSEVEGQAQATYYTWEPLPGKTGINYSDLRNQLFKRQENLDGLEQLSKQCSNVFYLTMDPDSDVTKEIFESVEAVVKESEPEPSPLIVVGHYTFDITDTDLVNEQGGLNWEGFISGIEAEFDHEMKKEISEKTFTIELQLDDEITEETCTQNIEIIESVLTQSPDRADKEELNTLMKYYKTIKKEPGNEDLKSETTSLKNSIDCTDIKITKEMKGESILYPSEPILFLSLFQKNVGFNLINKVICQ